MANPSLISIQDAAGAVSATTDGGTTTVIPGTTATFSLTSTSGVARWDLTFSCPNYPALHGRTFNWVAGMANSWSIPIPSESIGSSTAANGIAYTSVTSDGVQVISSTGGFIQTRGGTAYADTHEVRGVICASINSYVLSGGVITANVVNGIGTIDGLTVAVGDLYLLPDGIAQAATDVGIYQVTSLGSASTAFKLTRSPDWLTGALIRPKSEIRVTEGTLFAGTTWVYTGTGVGTVNTTSMTFLPRIVNQTYTFAAGIGATMNTVPLASKGNCAISFTPTNALSINATFLYAVNTYTAGALNTAVLTLAAQNVARLIAPADNSVGCLSIVNNV
ncbi:MAG TPA: hypothetical protein VKU44_00760 [Terriglobia bacterium]|nr:hypothetical protein [Terriglobia bacterium]